MEVGPFLSSHPLGENSASMIPAKPRVAEAGSWLPCSPPALILLSLLRPRLLCCLSRAQCPKSSQGGELEEFTLAVGIGVRVRTNFSPQQSVYIHTRKVFWLLGLASWLL